MPPFPVFFASGVQILTGLVVVEGDGVNRLERALLTTTFPSSKLDIILIHLTSLGKESWLSSLANPALG